MISALVAALLVQPTISSNMPGASIDLPPAIAPHVLPYMNCTMRRSNADPRMPTGEVAVLRAINADARAACADVRRRGTEAASRVLRRDRAHCNPALRLAFIGRVFDQVDRAQEALAAAVERMNAPADKD
jgi:hypothetical protein